MDKPTLYIGIDPGVNTGVAIWDAKQNKLEVFQFPSHCQALLFLVELLTPYHRSTLFFRIEDARKTKLRGDLAGANPGKEQGVGYVKGYSKDWEAFCKHMGYGYELLPPANTKVTPQYFFGLTQIKTMKTQSHLRDAGMLVFGR